MKPMFFLGTGGFNFVLANPPFNVNATDKERLKDSVGQDRRCAFGLWNCPDYGPHCRQAL